jgi:hypothetical protein
MPTKSCDAKSNKRKCLMKGPPRCARRCFASSLDPRTCRRWTGDSYKAGYQDSNKRKERGNFARETSAGGLAKNEQNMETQRNGRALNTAGYFGMQITRKQTGHHNIRIARYGLWFEGQTHCRSSKRISCLRWCSSRKVSSSMSVSAAPPSAPSSSPAGK